MTPDRNSNVQEVVQPIPVLKKAETDKFLRLAYRSVRRRVPKVLHKKGAYVNKVFNFLLQDTYMHPHLHSAAEKTEEITLIEGEIGLVFFSDTGEVIKSSVLSIETDNRVAVPPWTWHTYVVLSDHAITFELMRGRYNARTWKHLADWAPSEGCDGADQYLVSLKRAVHGNNLLTD